MKFVCLDWAMEMLAEVSKVGFDFQLEKHSLSTHFSFDVSDKAMMFDSLLFEDNFVFERVLLSVEPFLVRFSGYI